MAAANPLSPHAAHEAGRKAFERGVNLERARAAYLSRVTKAARGMDEAQRNLLAAYFNCGWCAAKNGQPLNGGR